MSNFAPAATQRLKGVPFSPVTCFLLIAAQAVFGELVLPRESRRFRDLYAGRASVEPEFGGLKNEYGLKPLRVRGLAKVALHTDLTMLTRLSQALARARAVPLAA